MEASFGCSEKSFCRVKVLLSVPPKEDQLEPPSVEALPAHLTSVDSSLLERSWALQSHFTVLDLASHSFAQHTRGAASRLSWKRQRIGGPQFPSQPPASAQVCNVFRTSASQGMKGLALFHLYSSVS